MIPTTGSTHLNFIGDKVLSFKMSYKVVVVNEMLTSKTCTSCGWVNHNLGPQAFNVCQQCNTVMGRDVGAGRNQFLMNLPAAKHACM